MQTIRDNQYWLSLVKTWFMIPGHLKNFNLQSRLNYADYIEKMTGTKVNELLEVSQDREAWRELMVACVIYNHPTREREREWYFVT